MSDQQPHSNGLDSLFGAVSSVVGYIDAEAATLKSFKQLLWPQRLMSGFTLRTAPQVALLYPMGGPLHKVALQTMDSFYHHGLLSGSLEGHMLGTSFFPELEWKPNFSEGDEQGSPVTRPIRNCLWALVFTSLGAPRSSTPTHGQGTEKGESTKPLHAQFPMGHLTLSKPNLSDATLPFVSEVVGGPSVRVILGTITAETVGILLTVIYLIKYKTFWSLFWLAPLIPRFFKEGGRFRLITGPPVLVLQFTRHYGHLIRNQPRELCQIILTTAFGSIFALGLLCSSL
ncbi:hypothetical protein N7452_003754 [Penicillium brevicompactum]|uniref:Uncharacterized protein n=1 Tax=Penicillium brevicompactum TaxID=5074 RepID=A0A9W9QU86_PENBR|nr:hypothetical protein N7452_003754 [Penicillium brevicompactum]